MSKVNEFINYEKERFGKIFVEITYAVDNISPFLDEADLKKRKYYIKLPVLKKYIDALDSYESQQKKKGFFSFLSDDNGIDLLKEYKQHNLSALTQLEKCSTCKCLNCSSPCRFDSCMGCREGSRIVSCDKRKINLTTHDNYTLNLTNDRTGASDSYTVLATLQDCELDRKYIIIRNTHSGEKFVLYYYPGLVDDEYGEINDAEEFDYVVSIFESINCD